ncbi:coiled-coil domain-containing protein 181 [Dendropsophus ebraccatus]|uniref:coiled-coil domain-containing protein 181 n=1 Tax=Dendropsophus ebraccatus TaxID=150705 RepID=UPI0038311E93
MSKKDESDSDGALEYEDDFEKDLDWLINEDAEKYKGSQSEEEEPSDLRLSDKEENESDKSSGSGDEIVQAEPSTHSKPVLDSVSECDEPDTEDEEAKRYIAEKIEEANKKLEMETVDENRERKLKFKENLVDLEVPPLEFPDSDRTESFTEDEVVDGMSQLQVDDAPARSREPSEKDGGAGEGPKDAKVLVEKDGKFELVYLRDIENQCSLPPIGNSKDNSKPSSHPERAGISASGNSSINNVNGFIPQPPFGPRVRPNSANLSKSVHKIKPQRRAQSANVSTRNTTFSLSPEQKELQKRILERQERLRRENEERKKEQEEQKRRENDMAFKMWLQRKNSQLLQEKRIQHAKELETSSSTPDEERDSQEAFHLWLRRKHKEKIKEKKMEELQKQEYEAFLLERKDREGAFAQWLKQKRIQKRTEQQAAKERSRRLLLEARRSKQIHSLLYNISDSKPFCYMDR